MVQFICYPKCTTCQKAKAWLDAKGVECEIRDIKLDNPTYAEIKKWYHENDYELKRFFNTSGLLYKSMELKSRLPAMPEEEQLRLLATDGMLVKRPIVVVGDKVLVGFKEKEWAEVFK
ncbi:MAG: arsenate reductase family protein [Oscillospiraceae bacterium]|nr:arsenate reductase family protein [Oscillospiraceae bacterium]